MLVFDDEQRGLAVRVTSAGGKTYLAQYTVNGQKRRTPLGAANAVSLAQAREAARIVMGEVAKGLDPAIERKEAKAAAVKSSLTFGKLLEDWSALHLSKRRPSYAYEAIRALRYAFNGAMERPACDLARSEVVCMLDDAVRNDTNAMASRTVCYGKAAYSWAIRRGVLTENPFMNLPVAPTTRRARVLTDAELKAVWHAAGEGAYGSIVRMLIITGQRREEVAGMYDEEVDPLLTVWVIPAHRAKNNNAHMVPLSAQAADIWLEQEYREGLVFPGRNGVFNSWSKSKEQLDKRSGVSDWTLHDIRRTVATGLQRLGVRLEVTEQILNHVSGSRAGVVGIYQRHDFAEEKRAALDAWGAHVAAIVKENK